MKTTINGIPLWEAIAQEILRQIQEANPAIRLEEYKDRKDIPGFEEAIRLPRYLALSMTSEKKNLEIRRKIWKTQRLDKDAIIDLRTAADGKPKTAACISSRTKSLLWELECDWDVMMGRDPV